MPLMIHFVFNCFPIEVFFNFNFNFIYSLRPINWYMRYKNNIIIYICTNWSEVHI